MKFINRWVASYFARILGPECVDPDLATQSVAESIREELCALEHCIKCGRFVGSEAIEVTNPAQATPHDPDGWTGTYICAPLRGCNFDGVVTLNGQTIESEPVTEPYGGRLAWRAQHDRRTHKRVSDWTDKLRDDRRIT